jgi:hypothetical protein
MGLIPVLTNEQSRRLGELLRAPLRGLKSLSPGKPPSDLDVYVVDAAGAAYRYEDGEWTAVTNSAGEPQTFEVVDTGDKRVAVQERYTGRLVVAGGDEGFPPGVSCACGNCYEGTLHGANADCCDTHPQYKVRLPTALAELFGVSEVTLTWDAGFTWVSEPLVLACYDGEDEYLVTGTFTKVGAKLVLAPTSAYLSCPAVYAEWRACCEWLCLCDNALELSIYRGFEKGAECKVCVKPQLSDCVDAGVCTGLASSAAWRAVIGGVTYTTTTAVTRTAGPGCAATFTGSCTYKACTWASPETEGKVFLFTLEKCSSGGMSGSCPFTANFRLMEGDTLLCAGGTVSSCLGWPYVMGILTFSPVCPGDQISVTAELIEGDQTAPPTSSGDCGEGEGGDGGDGGGGSTAGCEGTATISWDAFGLTWYVSGGACPEPSAPCTTSMCAALHPGRDGEFHGETIETTCVCCMSSSGDVCQEVAS